MRNILNVAIYETRTLFRSWFFRIFSILSLLILFGINMGMFGDQNARWTIRAIAANLPYINVLFMNVAQSVIAVFLASDFLRRDKKLDTTEVIYARPVTNGQYVVGKTLGILILFLGLVLLALAMALVINLVKQDVPVVWEAYLYYPLLIAVPTLVFILGLSFFLMILFRSQAVTFLLLLGYIGITLFYLQERAFGLLNYMAFNLPMVYSDFIQFAEPWPILMHRLTYLLLGIGFIFATIRFLNRLPQTGQWNNINLLAFAIFLLAGGVTGYRYYHAYQSREAQRDIFLEMNNRHARMDVVDVISNDLYVVQKGSSLTITSEIRMRNQHPRPLDTLLFSLNPGFVVDSINGRNGPVAYNLKEQLLKVIPERAIAPGGAGRLSIHYHGIPDESVANLDVSKETMTELKKIQVATIDKKPAIVDDSYMLLTPEILWYPVAGVGFNKVNFQSANLDFARFSLIVKPDKNLSAIAPGKVVLIDGQFRFSMENDLNALPLVIGPLEKRSMEAEGVEYNIYVKPGHDYFSGYFKSIQDTIGALIKAAKDDYELDDLDLYLEFNRVNLVEVPIQFHAYEKPYTQTVDYVFPEMILIPEKGAGLSTLDFGRFMHAAERQDRERDNERSPKEIETDMFKRFLQATFFRTSTSARRRGFDPDSRENLVNFHRGADYSNNPFCVFPLYYNYVTGISSLQYPVFNSMMEIYLKQGFEVSPRQGFTGGITDHERANLALKEKSMTDIFAGGKSELTSSLINQTGSYVFSALRNRVGMGNFDDFLYYYLEDRAFSEIPFERFEADFKEAFHVEISPYMEVISSAGQMAAFMISEPEYIQTRDDLGDVYLVRFRITNRGTARGMVDATFRIAGQGGFGGGGGMNTEQRLFEVDAGITKEVQVVLYDQPRMMTVNTLISGNIPSSSNHFLRTAQERKVNDLSEYERITNVPVSYSYEDEFVVDNEDEGFSCSAVSKVSKLKQYIDSRQKKEDEVYYGSLSHYMRPSLWHPVAHSAYYGETVRSAMASRTGDGGNVARWTTTLPETGFYDVYVYIPLSAMYSRQQGRGERDSGEGNRRRGPRFDDEGTDYHYTLASNEGTEEVIFVLKGLENGWNRLGSYHFPSDTVSIILTNQSTKGFRVIADAVKWVWRPN